VRGAGQSVMAEAAGEVEADDNVLVLKRIHVRLHVRAEKEQRAAVERVHVSFAGACPVYRSLRGAIQITTEVLFG